MFSVGDCETPEKSSSDCRAGTDRVCLWKWKTILSYGTSGILQVGCLYHLRRLWKDDHGGMSKWI